ncbi:efflux RND transporter periplasmic adaptor subunit [Chitinophaga tropicalis]|nr:efflux RND transporter periplasmic adaptor subunit [Chitinophaga tropicalis]
MNNIKAFALTIFCGIPAALLLSSCGQTEGKAENKSPVAEAPAVAAVTLHKGKLSSSLQIPGELIAFQQVDIYAKVNSFVKKLNVDVGSEVSAGTLLATMEAPEISSQLAGAESKLKSQEAVYLASKANYDRLHETSLTPGTVSKNDLDIALARQNSDKAQLDAARAAYREIADTRNYLEIRAPFSGVITARNVSAGAYVGPSGKGSEFPLFTLQEQKKLRLVISVPEAYTSYLGNNSEVEFTVKAFTGKTFAARVNRLAGALDNRLRSQRIEMDVPNNDKKLLPGMIAEVHIPMNTADSAFIVPKTAVVNSTVNVFVVRVVNGKAERVQVQTGREADGNIEIYGNLNPGDTIVSVATEELREGQELKNVKTGK